MTARESSEIRRRQIADAALDVIAEEGLARFTSLAIARRIGLSDGALFRHFATKDEIVLAAIDRVEELFFGEPLPVGGDPFERLGAFFERRLRLMREHPGIARLINSGELAHAAPPEGVARVGSLKRRSMGFVRACLEEAAATGALRGGVQPDEAMVMVVGSLFALVNLGIDGSRNDLPRRVWRTLEGFLRGGAEAPAAVPRARAKPGVRARPPTRRPRAGEA